MKNYVSMFVMIIVGFILQTTLFRHLRIAGVSPNILVILTAIAGTMYGQYCGLFTGVISGLFVDMMFSSIIGVNIFIYAVIGFIIGMTNKMYIDEDPTKVLSYAYDTVINRVNLRGKYIEDDLIFPTMTIAIGDIIYGILFYVLKFLLRGRLRLTDYLMNTIIPELIYTIILGVIVFKFAHWLDRKLNPPEPVHLGVETKPDDEQ